MAIFFVSVPVIVQNHLKIIPQSSQVDSQVFFLVDGRKLAISCHLGHIVDEKLRYTWAKLTADHVQRAVGWRWGGWLNRKIGWLWHQRPVPSHTNSKYWFLNQILTVEAADQKTLFEDDDKQPFLLFERGKQIIIFLENNLLIVSIVSCLPSEDKAAEAYSLLRPVSVSFMIEVMQRERES